MMKYAPLFAKAAWTTLGIGAAGIFLSFLAGLVISVIRYRKIPFLLPLSTAYVELSRNTPLLVQLFFLYFGLPKAGIHISGPRPYGASDFPFRSSPAGFYRFPSASLRKHLISYQRNLCFQRLRSA